MFQHTGMELGDNLKACTANALQKYSEINRALPDRIIIYRDGVGDGQVCCAIRFVNILLFPAGILPGVLFSASFDSLWSRLL